MTDTSVPAGAAPLSGYFDYNATAPLKPGARAAMLRAFDLAGNPSSIHKAGRSARTLLENSRSTVATAVAARPDQVVFTSGGTESVQLALRGVLGANDQPLPCLISAVEHDCTLAARSDVQRLPVDCQGRVDPEALRAALTQPALISIMLANNETGVIQDIPTLAVIIHAAGGLLHVDASQALGKIPVNMLLLGADLMTLSAHKCGGPKGVGALVVADGIALTPQQTGGGQENRRRAGTENLPGIAGFAGALATLTDDLAFMRQLGQWRDVFENRLLDAAPEAIIHGARAPRLPNTSCLSLPSRAAATQLMALDLTGFAVSTGAACASGKVTPSHVLQAMGCSEQTAREAIRISSGWATTQADYENLLAAWLAMYSRAKAA